MPSIIHSGNNNSPNIINQLLSAIQAAVYDIQMFYNKLMGGWSGTFTDGDGGTVTVQNGLVISVEAPPSFKLIWNAIGNALHTTVGDYNTFFGSDFTTLTVDGNDQLLTGNSTTFAMPDEAFFENGNIIAVDDSIESCSSVPLISSFSTCTNLESVSLPACTFFAGIPVSTALANLNIPLCENLGGTTGDDSVFFNISGNTITLTIAASRQTCDGGNPDGDIVYLSANNTATINYV